MQFLDFLNDSPTPFHAVETVKKVLIKENFHQLDETQKWDTKPGNRYFVIRGDTTIAAFVIGNKFVPGNGFNIVAAHTDSPNFRVRPNSKVESNEILKVGVEPYGGGIWETWFDRDLTVAGKVHYKTKSSSGAESGVLSKLVHIKRPILRIPSLAIHLAPGYKFSYDTQDSVIPILATKIFDGLSKESNVHHHSILLELLATELRCKPGDILNFDLSLVDTQPACLGGAYDEFVFSGRLDNLASCYVAMKSLLSSKKTEEDTSVRCFVLFDHEEIGSKSAQGAASSFLTDIIKRVNVVNQEQSFAASFIVSADMSHGIHPNYPGEHEEQHQVHLQKGVAVKYNAQQKYSTDSLSALIIMELAKKSGVPVQEFSSRNDKPCGSTVGPILSTLAGIRTVDIGIPQLSMHSIREMCGVNDVESCTQLLKVFYEDFNTVYKTFERT